MRLQENIDRIVLSCAPSVDKISDLKKLFKENNIHYFSDFDDTISDWRCVFYSKVKLQRLFKTPQYEALLENFRFNKTFLLYWNKNIKGGSLIIISRNQHTFLKTFQTRYANMFLQEGVELIWCVWQADDFHFSSYDKLWFLPSNTCFIWDSFEDNKLQTYHFFINVLPLNSLQKRIVLLRKAVILLYFFVRWC